MGAVLGTVAAEGTVCIYQTVVVRKELNFRKYFRDSVTYLLIGGIMYVLVDQIGAKMKESILTLVTQIGVGACVFICLCVIYIIIDKQNCIHKLYIGRFQRREKRWKKNKKISCKIPCRKKQSITETGSGVICQALENG